MDIKILEERATLALSGQLPALCSANCPASCCDPVITGTFLPKSLLLERDDFTEAELIIQSKINEMLETKTSDGEACFTFEGVVLSDIDTQEGFISEKAIKEMLLKRLGKIPPPEKLEEYVFKIREKFREINTGILMVFSCNNYDTDTKSCTSYNTRPDMCIGYVCEQLNPEKINYSKNILVQRMKMKREQTEFIMKNRKKNVREAINLFLEKII